MNYEKKYKEALERARKLYEQGTITESLSHVFPELKESEDERIRKHLIGVVELYYGNTDEQEKKDCLDWLEKQCGQKPAELPKGEDYGIDGLYAAIDILQKTLGEVDGYQSDDGILAHKCAISAVKELSKQELSEEDELIINKILCICSDFERSFEMSPLSTKVIKEDVDKIDTWLKSLKDKYTWKPSEEQILAIETAINVIGKGTLNGGQLTELLEQVKAL